MTRRAAATTAALAILLLAGAIPAVAQTAFKIPFPFQAGGNKLPSGDYTISKTAEGPLTLRQETTGKVFKVSFTERLAQPRPPLAEPQLVFDEVGDFAPSYTEYVTVYILSEVWFLREDGFRTHTTKGAHKTRVVKVEGIK
jgi:hypothetical protein